MGKIEKAVQKIIDKMSVIFVLLFILAFYFVWTTGLSDPNASFLYEHSTQFATYAVIVLFLLNLYKARGADFIYIGAAVVTFVFFAYFRDSRSSSFYGDMLIPLIIGFVLTIKWTNFTKWDRAFYFLIFYLILGITVYQVFTQIQVPDGQSLWAADNKLSDIWINTNTIGSSLMTLAFLVTGFASSFERWYMRMLTVPANIAAFLAIWVCQSRGALVALIVFWVLDIVPKVVMRFIRAPFIAYALTTILALPISYIAAQSETINLFTGREDIWKDFYQTLSEKTSQVWVGMKPFLYTKRPNQVLGNHNSYNSIVNLYGIVGLIVVVLLLLFFVGRLTLKADLSNGQMTFLWAFFGVMTQSFMEDTLVSFAWLPIIYLLLGMSTHRYEKKKLLETPPMPIEEQEEQLYDSESRVARYHGN